jgi:hypothetical protein
MLVAPLMARLNLKTAVESGRLAEAVVASALRGFVRRTNRCAFTNPPSASAPASSRNTSPPTAVFRLEGSARNCLCISEAQALGRDKSNSRSVGGTTKLFRMEFSETKER